MTRLRIENILEELYGTSPTGTLYHYTALEAMQGILAERGLWATDIHYFNDFAELRQTATLMSAELHARTHSSSASSEILTQVDRWVSDLVAEGPTVFVASLTPNGNLLSQWRGYGPYGRGVSLGFPASHIMACAAEQSYAVGRCIYDVDRQRHVIRELVDILYAEACAATGDGESQATECRGGTFVHLQDAILRIAALFKHPSFREEDEWRAVSAVLDSDSAEAVRYRVGQFTLIPYRFFSLARQENTPVELSRVYVGPSPHTRLSIRSLQQLLAQNGLTPPITSSEVPYRET